MWKEDEPRITEQNLSILLYNVEGLTTHITDVDILLAKYLPHICILTGVGAAIERNITFPNYNSMSQEGTNAFGGVMILTHRSINCSLIAKETNFIRIEIPLTQETIHIGGIYVPPGSLPPLHLMTANDDSDYVLFGDFNAKHTEWNCTRNNTSGNHLLSWLKATGTQLIAPTKPTSKRSEAVVDLGIVKDSNGWTAEVLGEGTSDHYPVIFQSSLAINRQSKFRITRWNTFTFFLELVREYWLSLVYNMDENSFFGIFSSFLASLFDRCSYTEEASKFRSPWPPALVLLARQTNKARRKYRRTRQETNLQEFLVLRDIYQNERDAYLKEKNNGPLNNNGNNKNIWHIAKPHFHNYSPAFRGLTEGTEKITKADEIVDKLADFFEDHFKEPSYDLMNKAHREALTHSSMIDYMPEIPIDPITYAEVYVEWKKFKGKKSIDSAGTSAFMLKQLPEKYVEIFTVLFNKCASNGSFFDKGKHAKIICLSKDSLFPARSNLRPISLLPNIAKWFERIIHNRIIGWCEQMNIYVDEQSGFTERRRLQTRIVSLVDDVRLTVAACNRPALTIFVDFLSAFDKMWYPALISSLTKLDMPLAMTKWISLWLKNRTFAIHQGDARSRMIQMKVGAPQGSVLAATLFRLHIHTLPLLFPQISTHLFADDLAIVLVGSIEKKFSVNIRDIEVKAKQAMQCLEKFALDNILPVNVSKTKALLIHSVVSPPTPKIEYQGQRIEIVQEFKYLGVRIATKLGWGKYINARMKKIRSIYNAMKMIYTKIPRNFSAIRRRIFLAYALPQFVWLFSTWFYFTEKQQTQITSTFSSGLRIVYGLHRWNDENTLILSQEKSLNDYIFNYWSKLALHLERAHEAVQCQQSWSAYLTVTSPNRMWMKSMGFRRDSFFPNRLTKRAKHSKNDWTNFCTNHSQHHEYYRRSTTLLNMLIYKYFILSPQ